MREYTTIKAPYETELVIKKSRFIGRLFPTDSFDEAALVLADIKKRFWDASHNCSAMLIGPGQEFSRCSDDGEPQGTAGVPMLEALKKNGLTNVLAIVTRYFGGTLLGAGGLVRAYTAAVAEAAAGAQKIIRRPMRLYQADITFAQWSRAQSQLAAAGYTLGEIGYTDIVAARIYAQPGSEEALIKLISELTNGNVTPKLLGEEYAEILI